ncbi:hypothetical protein B7463_g48, partial [Scytalidium lignicola]
MKIPTPQQRELWAKAVQTPGQLSEEERHLVLGRADRATQVANVFRDIPNREMDLPFEDLMANIRAEAAVQTPYEAAIRDAANRRSDFFAQQQAQKVEETMRKYAEDLKRPCKWVRKLIDPNKPDSEQTLYWSFVVLRDISTITDDTAWERFLQLANKWIDSGLNWVHGGITIRQTKQMIFLNNFFNEKNPEEMRKAFQQHVIPEADLNPRILSNTFLFVTSEVMKAVGDMSNPWIWAYESNFTPSETTQDAVGTDRYNGRLKVNLRSLFTWFYAVRSEKLYTMQQFWEKAQRDPEQAWQVSTHSGVYHYPLVLLEKGTVWPITAYELENEP